MEPQSAVKIPHEQLPDATLRSVIEEFVTRDGTVTTDAADNIEAVKTLLRDGEVELWFDPTTRTCNIVRV